MTRSVLTRGLHSLLAFSVMYQLGSSLIMKGPRHGHEAAGLPGELFELHEWVGLGALAVVALFWAWALVRTGETRLGVLVPWVSGDRLRDLKADLARHIAALRRRTLPPYEPRSPLAGAVHGLGLLLISAMVVTGTVYFIWHGAGGAAGIAAKAAMEVHTTLANVVWAYLIGHAGMALLHRLVGHDIIQPMFNLRRNGAAALDTTARARGDTSRSVL